MPIPISVGLPTGAGSWRASSNRCWRGGCRARSSPMPCCRRGSPPPRTRRVRRWPKPSPPSSASPQPNTAGGVREKFLLETLDDIAARSCVGEALEAPGSGNLLGHAHEPTPGRARQRTPDADAPDAELSEVAHGQIACETHQEVDGLRRHRLDHSFDLLARADSRRVEAVSTRIGVSLEAPNGLAHVNP